MEHISSKEIEISFDLLIGADGAHSAARQQLMKYTRIDYQQEYIDTLWCEFTISPVVDPNKEISESNFRISAHHLHIWPGKQHMFIAIPSLVSRPLRIAIILLIELGRIIYVHPVHALCTIYFSRG